MRLEEYKKTKNIGIFYPKEVEINLLSLCDDVSKNFYLPKVQDLQMEFYKFEGIENLEKGKFDILEPKSDVAAKPDLIVTPALMADKNGFRLGWGGGFYDRYLEKYDGIIICPIPSCQFVEELPSEAHDKKCDFVITENEIIKIL